MIKKPTISIDDAYDDFGFSAVSEDELKEIERTLQENLEKTASQLGAVSEQYQTKLEALYKLIMPLLMNLKKNPEKEYIYWPNRAEKVTEFINKVEKLVND
jgi:hypothetical protein